jgi:ornithine decarboxylase
MSPRRIDRALSLWNCYLPEVFPYYAVKCNSDPQFLDYLSKIGLSFDCASAHELTVAKGLTKAVHRIMYANPCKSFDDLQRAKLIGNPTTVVDSVEEILKLKDASYGGSVLIRLKVDDSDTRIPFSTKFGANRDILESIVKTASAHSIKLIGYSFHVGTGGTSAKTFSDAIYTARSILPLLTQYGHHPRLLNIGGGFLADEDDFKQKARCISSSIQYLENYYIRVIAEPGRFFATNSFNLYVKVIGKKKCQGLTYYTINESLYGQFSNILFDHATPTWFRVSGESRPRGPGVLFGRTCDSTDVIARSNDMETLEIDDWLCFPNMGAYTTASASEFNGFPKPDVFMTDECVEPRETPKEVSYPSPMKNLLAS